MYVIVVQYAILISLTNMGISVLFIDLIPYLRYINSLESHWPVRKITQQTKKFYS